MSTAPINHTIDLDELRDENFVAKTLIASCAWKRLYVHVDVFLDELSYVVSGKFGEPITFCKFKNACQFYNNQLPPNED